MAYHQPQDLNNYISIPSGFVVEADMHLIFFIKMQQEKGICSPKYIHYVSHNWKILVAVSSTSIFCPPAVSAKIIMCGLFLEYI